MISAIIYGIQKLAKVEDKEDMEEKRAQAKQLRAEGKYMSALQAYQEILMHDLKKYGPLDKKIIADYYNISNLYENLHDYKKALEYQKQSLDTMKKMDAAMHPSIAMVMSDIARLNSKLGNNEEGLKNMQQAYEILCKYFGPTHSEVLLTLNDLGDINFRMNRYEEALQIYDKILKVYEETNGINQRTFAVTLNKKGSVYLEMKEFKKAIEHFEKAYEILCKYFGPTHSEVLLTLNDLGDINFRMNRYEEALQIYDKILKVYEETNGINQRTFAVTLNKKGSVYLEMKEFKKAIEHFEKAYEILKTVYQSQSHPELSIILDDMALAYEVSGEKDKALELYLQALEINEKFAEDRPEAKLNSFNQIGRLNSRIGNYDQAIEFFEKALNFAKSNLSTDQSVIANEYSILALCYERMNNLDKALEDISKSIEIEFQAKGGESKEAALSLSHKGRFLALKGENEEGLKLCNQALEIIQRVAPNNISETGRINHDIGRCYILGGDIRKARGYIRTAKLLLEKTHGSDELFLGFCLKDAAEVEFNLGNRTIARELLKNAFKIFKYFLGKDNQVVIDTIRLDEEWEKFGLMDKSHTKLH